MIMLCLVTLAEALAQTSFTRISLSTFFIDLTIFQELSLW